MKYEITEKFVINTVHVMKSGPAEKKLYLHMLFDHEM